MYLKRTVCREFGAFRSLVKSVVNRLQCRIIYYVQMDNLTNL